MNILKEIIDIPNKPTEDVINNDGKDNNDVNYNEISKNVINALISTEDKRFFKHKGIDLIGIVRAMIINIRNKHFVQGGSTITQQLSKMIIGNNEKTLLRKYKEMFLAFRLEKFFTKEEILTMYLNSNLYYLNA